MNSKNFNYGIWISIFQFICLFACSFVWYGKLGFNFMIEILMTKTISKGGVVQLGISRHLTTRISNMELKCVFFNLISKKLNNYSPLLLQVSLKEILPICLSIWDCHFCAESGRKWKNLDEVFPELKLIHQIKSKKNDCL